LKKECEYITSLYQEQINYQVEIENQNRLLNDKVNHYTKIINTLKEFLDSEAKSNDMHDIKKEVEQDISVFGNTISTYENDHFIKEFKNIIRKNNGEETEDNISEKKN